MELKMDKAERYFKDHPTLSVANAEALGISRAELKRWVDTGKLYRVGRGVYSPLEPTNTAEQVVSTLRGPCAIAGITALIHYGYTNIIGHKIWVVVPKGHSIISKADVVTMRQKPEVFEIGLETLESEWGTVQIVDREKAVLDAYRGRFLDREEQYRVLKRYLRDPAHNYNRLLEYAYKMRVNKNFHELFTFLDADL